MIVEYTGRSLVWGVGGYSISESPLCHWSFSVLYSFKVGWAPACGVLLDSPGQCHQGEGDPHIV